VTTLLPGTDIDIRRLPKVSLHDHLDGGLRPGTIIDLAPSHALELPTTDPAELAQWFADQSDSGSLVEYLKTFDITTGVMQTADALHRVAKEFVEDLADDGVIYGEIRWAPEQHRRMGLSLDDAVEAVQAGLDEGVASVRASGRAIRVGQLISAMRHLDNGVAIAELALRHRDRGAVGFDIAGPEAGFPPSRMADAFDILWAGHFPVTIHAGEADGLDSIRSALTDGRALRLGHGVRIAEDLDVTVSAHETTVVMGRLAQWVKDRQIALETSPSSNIQTGAIALWGTDMASHPFDLLYQLGFCVTVNTDNRLMSGTTLTRELLLLSETFGYDLEDLLTFQINAAHHAFLPLEDREELIDAIIRGFDQV
jgi:adenosine deaminase